MARPPAPPGSIARLLPQPGPVMGVFPVAVAVPAEQSPVLDLRAAALRFGDNVVQLREAAMPHLYWKLDQDNPDYSGRYRHRRLHPGR